MDMDNELMEEETIEESGINTIVIKATDKLDMFNQLKHYEQHKDYVYRYAEWDLLRSDFKKPDKEQMSLFSLYQQQQNDEVCCICHKEVSIGMVISYAYWKRNGNKLKDTSIYCFLCLDCFLNKN